MEGRCSKFLPVNLIPFFFLIPPQKHISTHKESTPENHQRSNYVTSLLWRSPFKALEKWPLLHWSDSHAQIHPVRGGPLLRTIVSKHYGKKIDRKCKGKKTPRLKSHGSERIHLRSHSRGKRDTADNGKRPVSFLSLKVKNTSTQCKQHQFHLQFQKKNIITVWRLN